eukprot:s2320_g11.t1
MPRGRGADVMRCRDKKMSRETDVELTSRLLLRKVQKEVSRKNRFPNTQACYIIGGMLELEIHELSDSEPAIKMLVDQGTHIYDFGALADAFFPANFSEPNEALQILKDLGEVNPSGHKP